MNEQFLTDVITPVGVDELYSTLRAAWRVQLGGEPTRASLLVLMAHWALETGRGKACHCFNLGNAKHLLGDGRDYTMFRCSEIIGGKEIWYDPPHPATWFRAFLTLEEGVLDYLDLIHRQFGYAWPAVEAGDPADFCKRLKARGYFTADLNLYTAGVVRCYKELDASIQPDTLPDVASFAKASIEEAGLAIDETPDEEPPDAGS